MCLILVDKKDEPKRVSDVFVNVFSVQLGSESVLMDWYCHGKQRLLQKVTSTEVPWFLVPLAQVSKREVNNLRGKSQG